MAVQEPRNRIVAIRLAEAEFQHVKDLCNAEGARSISDYARASLCKSMTARSMAPDVALDAQMRRLDTKVDELDRAIKEFGQLLRELAARSQK